jgi:uroporphyrinogen-III decarboxylase
VTKKQAFLTALRGEQPDRVPVSPLVHRRFANALLGRSDWRAVFEVHQMLGTTYFRGPLGGASLLELPPGFAINESEERVGDLRRARTEYCTPRGPLTQTVQWGAIPHDPLVPVTVEHAVKEPDEWHTIIEFWHAEAEGLSPARETTLAEAVRAIGEEGVADAGIGCAYGMMGLARDMGPLMLDLIDHPALIRAVAEAAWAVVEKQLEGFIASPAEVVHYDICWATGSNMGPARFEEWVGPEIRQACDMVRGAGKYITFYTLGRIGELMDCMVDAGPHMIATFETNEGDITLGEARRRYGDRVCLMGNFDCVVLSRGSVEDARREARRCLDEAMAGGGYIMGTGDEVPADARMDNLRAMVEVVQEYGGY